MIQIVRVPFLLAWPPGAYAAQVILPERIFVLKGQHLTPTLIAHELCHVVQLRRYGLVRYWLKYLLLLIRHGYDDHPMEKEANEFALTPEAHAWAVRVLAR